MESEPSLRSRKRVQIRGQNSRSGTRARDIRESALEAGPAPVNRNQTEEGRQKGEVRLCEPLRWRQIKEWLVTQQFEPSFRHTQALNQGASARARGWNQMLGPGRAAQH